MILSVSCCRISGWCPFYRQKIQLLIEYTNPAEHFVDVLSGHKSSHQTQPTALHQGRELIHYAIVLGFVTFDPPTLPSLMNEIEAVALQAILDANFAKPASLYAKSAEDLFNNSVLAILAVDLEAKRLEPFGIGADFLENCIDFFSGKIAGISGELADEVTQGQSGFGIHDGYSLQSDMR